MAFPYSGFHVPIPQAAPRGAQGPSAKQPLQTWPDAQETTIGSLEDRGRRRPAGQKAERTQKRDGPPHGSKRLSARKQLPAFFGMKPRKQLGAIDGAGPAWVAGIDKVDCPASIETAHQRDLPEAERTTAIEPNSDLRRHGTTLPKDVVPSIWASTCIPAMRPDAAGQKGRQISRAASDPGPSRLLRHGRAQFGIAASAIWCFSGPALLSYRTGIDKKRDVR